MTSVATKKPWARTSSIVIERVGTSDEYSLIAGGEYINIFESFGDVMMAIRERLLDDLRASDEAEYTA